MKKILVTGADGFIGSHLAELLTQNGFQVKALCQYNSFNSWGWLDTSPLAKEMEIVSGDVRDPFFCKTISKDIDVIFHLAALIAIPFSYHAPQSYVETNVTGTLNICQAALENDISQVIHTSTSEVYGTAQYVPIDENHPLQAQSPYSASKIAADAMAVSYFNAFQLPITIARPFNTYGPRQSARAVIPSIITQIANGAEVLKLGDLAPTRDFNYVEDTCNAFISLLNKTNILGETINLGSNSEISISDTVKKIITLMNKNVTIEQDEQRLRPKNSEVFRLLCDNTKLKEKTGFEHSVTIDAGLQKTIEWFTNPDNLRQYKANIYNI
ncbi:NAD-dependent 4,6-dehydratase LegB [Catenovulum sediminis]|uniref:NAD-dependent 4,6-dehydratase LegB n=1 Tax=Catenovulum sediminis TaxID=1740262 RepID=UPI001180F7B1|nr:NAD-dependent 4,6-dehydratase LegB [Catenovulum sediminis]